MGMKSKRKGKVGEREWAQYLRDHGIEARRGVQFQGGKDSPDVVSSLPGVHFEVKRVEKLDLWSSLGQALEDAAPHEAAVVAHRSNRHPWIIIMTADAFLAVLREKHNG